MTLYDILKAARRKETANTDFMTVLRARSTAMYKGVTTVIKTITGSLPFTFNSTGANLAEWSLSGNMTQTGTPTPTTPIQPQECGERTGNLFDEDYSDIGNSVKYRAFYVGDGTFTLSTTMPAHEVSGTTYTNLFFLSGNVTTGSNTNINGVWLDNPRTITSSNGYVTIGYRDQIISPVNYKTMLNSGSTALPYSPYGYKLDISSGGTTTPVHLGEVETTRQIRKLVLDGTENWTYQSAYTRFVLNLENAIFLGIRLTPIICTHYITIDDGRSIDNIPNNAIYIGGSAGSAQISIKTDLYTTAADFKSYLQQQYAAGTPVCVWYVLAEPTTAVINEPLRKIDTYADTISNAATIPTVNGSNTFDVSTTLKPSEATIKYYSADALRQLNITQGSKTKKKSTRKKGT